MGSKLHIDHDLWLLNRPRFPSCQLSRHHLEMHILWDTDVVFSVFCVISQETWTRGNIFLVFSSTIGCDIKKLYPMYFLYFFKKVLECKMLSDIKIGQHFIRKIASNFKTYEEFGQNCKTAVNQPNLVQTSLQSEICQERVFQESTKSLSRVVQESSNSHSGVFQESSRSFWRVV